MTQAIHHNNLKHQQRYHGLDFLRGVMMLLGVVIHSCVFYMTMPGGYHDPSTSPVMDYIVILISAFRMPAFFILSGFFTALLFYRRGLGKMLHNRYQRILIPFIIFLPLTTLTLSPLFVVSKYLSTHGTFGWDIQLLENTSYLWNTTSHLWFMYYLIMYLMVTAGFIRLQESINSTLFSQLKQKLISGFHHSIQYFYGIVIFGALIGLIGLNDSGGRVLGNESLIPEFETFFFYIAFYLLGWIIYLAPGLLEVFRKYCWQYLMAALLILGLAIAAWLNQGEPEDQYYPLLHTFLTCSNGVIACLLSFSLMGLSLRFCSNYNPWFRYITDASYWVYLLHMTINLALVLLFYNWSASAEIKSTTVILLSTIICFSSYHFFVRSTAIGKLLNGRRYPLSLPRADSRSPL